MNDRIKIRLSDPEGEFAAFAVPNTARATVAAAVEHYEKLGRGPITLSFEAEGGRIVATCTVPRKAGEPLAVRVTDHDTVEVSGTTLDDLAGAVARALASVPAGGDA